MSKNPEKPAQKPVPDAAKRALAEAAERRQHAENGVAAPKEHGGRNGPEPTRYGDWERDGILSDF